MDMYILYHLEKEKICGYEVMDEEEADARNKELIEHNDFYRWIQEEDGEDA